MSADAVNLIVSSLVTGYRVGLGQQQVLTRCSFVLESGMIVSLIGPNGCGKTTLLKTLLGLLPPLSGSVTLGGLSLDRYRAHKGIGYLPEGLVLPDAWSARGIFTLTALASAPAAAASLDRAIELAGIDFSLDLPISEMSRGMRQRVALAIALLPLPELLLLDEPEAGLDPGQRVGLRGRIQRFARAGGIVIVASHDVAGVCSIADRTFLLRDQSLQQLNAGELAHPERILQLFGHGDSA